MAKRLGAARLAVESRLDALFNTSWVPPAGDAHQPAAPTSTSNADGPHRATRWRIDPGRRAAAAMLAVVALTAAVVGWRVLADRPHAEALPDSATVRVSAPHSVSGPGSGRPGSSPAVRASAPIVVDVVGKVRRPGIVRLAAGSRVNDALRSAGGALPGTKLSTVNLARVCVDGEQIVIGLTGVAAAPGSSAAQVPAPIPGASRAATGGPLIDLNTASADQLDALPGVGPVMAQRILDWRTSHGAFTSVDQLKQVSGIGEAKYADISPLVTV